MTERIAIRAGTSLTEENGALTLAAPRLRLDLGPISPGLRDALHLLLERSATEDELFQRAVAADGPMAGPYLAYLLSQLDSVSLLWRTIVAADGPLATVVPVVLEAKRSEVAFDPETRYVLCRFAWLHSEDGALLLESPCLQFRIRLYDAGAAACIFGFAAPIRGAQVAGVESYRPLLDVLVGSGFLVDADQPAVESLLTWELHDLIFHMRSRLGRNDRPYGGTYRFEGVLAPLPAVKEGMPGVEIELPVPDRAAAARQEPLFIDVVENRRSIRRLGEAPINLAQLGELLYRSVRAKKIFAGKNGELSSRPYPGGGAIYELEVYAVVDRCAGLESGLYHYRPDRHVLSQIRGRTAPVERLLENAYLTLNRESKPQILLVFTARFARVAMKYESMAYALILKDVGVLQATLYLVSTAMGLAPCALGGGDSELFAAASGLDPFAEGAVGELVVGTRSTESEEEA